MVETRNGRKILIVDDEAESAILKAIRRRVEEEGWGIVVIEPERGCSIGEEFEAAALWSIEESQPDAVLLDGEGAECILQGVYVAGGQQHIENRTLIDHAKPRCTSRELYKGVLGDGARGVFNGKIVVRS